MNLPPLPYLGPGVEIGGVRYFTTFEVLTFARQAQREAVAGPDGWEANAQYLLDKCPYTVWQRPSAGPLDLLSTLVVTFSGMQMRLQGHPMFSAENKREAVAAAVPEGWKLVPIEPTEEMIQAANDGDREYTLRNFGDIQTVQQGPYDHWCAMLAASPEVKS